MATIEELEASGAEIKEAEAAVLYALAEGMRELAVHLPTGSSLAVRLAVEAKQLEEISTWADTASNPGTTGAMSMRNFVRRVLNERKAAES